MFGGLDILNDLSHMKNAPTTETLKTANQIIKSAFMFAINNNKFRTFANIFRVTIDEYFSAEMNTEAMRGMTFSEWSGYVIYDTNWDNQISYAGMESKLNKFKELAIKKGLISTN